MAVSEKINLMDLDRKGFESFVESLGHKAFHGRNIMKWIHKHGVTEFDAMSDVSKKLRLQLAQTAEIAIPEIIFEQPASDGTIKWILELNDGQRIETVFIPEGDRATLCVSSQVGCALNCSFCSTAQQGFNRNLTTAEIIGQVWQVTHEMKQPLSNVVMMGMGEPLANFDAVVPAMNLMQDDQAYMLSRHRVTLSTSGIVPAIDKLREVSNTALAVSLHAPNNELRNKLVPINEKYPLEQLIPACKAYLRGEKRRKITWEYVMLDGINDTVKHARELIRLLEGTPSKINLIPFNLFPGTDYKSSPRERIDKFRERLVRSGLVVITRKTRGEDIDAACGQLVGKVRDRSRRQLRGLSR
ncbi:MAG: 23S rRNA (adenine(2503)-C(2))-methyltransferase RlmN [Gammaproteobacteria bacterium]|nr:23S rRNA (adenine(2503)-C(2))-methyltransferase RlmN [Gammaproteobacteria bacterium]